MLYRLLPLLLAVTSLPVIAAESGKPLDGNGQASEQQRLEGYGWTLYDNLFSNGESYLYSPLSHSLDSQLRLAAFDHWNDVHTGGGRSLLWQDPERGLINAIASYLDYSTGHYYRFGAEGEWYHGSLTASGRAGYLHNTGQPGYLFNTDSFESQPFAGIDLRWYATDNLSFQIGGEQINDITLGKIRLEYQPRFDSLNGLSFFARAAHGSQDNEYVLGGVRYSFGQGFGESPSLLLRDRGNPAATGVDQLSPDFKSLYYYDR